MLSTLYVLIAMYLSIHSNIINANYDPISMDKQNKDKTKTYFFIFWSFSLHFSIYIHQYKQFSIFKYNSHEVHNSFNLTSFSYQILSIKFHFIVTNIIIFFFYINLEQNVYIAIFNRIVICVNSWLFVVSNSLFCIGCDAASHLWCLNWITVSRRHFENNCVARMFECRLLNASYTFNHNRSLLLSQFACDICADIHWNIGSIDSVRWIKWMKFISIAAKKNTIKNIHRRNR